MDTRTREAIRYLGYGKHAIDNQTFSLVLEAFDELDRIVEKRMIYRIFNIHMSGDDCMGIENIKIQSKNLAKNLNLTLNLYIRVRIWRKICVAVRKWFFWELRLEFRWISL